MRRRLTLTRAARGLALSASALALGACGSTSKKSSVPASGAPPTGATALAVSVKELGAGSVAFTTPASISGGLVNIQLTNAGRKPHTAQIIRLDPGHTIDEAFKVLNGNTTPLWLHGAGGVGGTDPATTSSAQVVLPAGSYYIVDSGQKTSRGFAKFEVQGSGSAAALPATAATITAQEIGPKKSAFKISGLKAGENAITLQSPATNKELHHFAAIQLRPGATLAAAKKFLAARGKPSGPPPFLGRPGEGGHNAAVIDPGLGEIANIKLTAGSYVFLCFLSDRDGGPPHFTEGMIAKVDVK